MVQDVLMIMALDPCVSYWAVKFAVAVAVAVARFAVYYKVPAGIYLETWVI